MTLGGYDRKYRSGYNKKKKYRTPYVPAEAEAAAASTPTTVAELLAAADPAQELIDIMGHGTLPTHLWDFSVASGATDIVASANLTDVSSPTKEKDVSAAFGTGAKATAFTDSGPESCDAASNTVGDVGSESMALLVLFKFNATVGTTEQIIQKKDGADAGWNFIGLGTNALRFLIENTTGLLRLVTLAVDHGLVNPQTVLAINDQTNDLLAIYSREGSSETTASAGSFTNAATLTAGQSPDDTAAPVDILMAALWIGTGAVGITNAMRLAVAQQLGLEA